jgi:hypothetical protein
MTSVGIETHRSSAAGLIIRQKEPTNLEMPFDQLDSYLTPTELFYIRSHFPVPEIDVANYLLDAGQRSVAAARALRRLSSLLLLRQPPCKPAVKPNRAYSSISCHSPESWNAAALPQ